MKSPFQKFKFNWAFALIFLNLILIYLYIFYVILNYDLTWVEFEKLKTHIWILEYGKQWHWGDFARALNTKIIEIDPNRLSRPLSNLVEVIDAKFRANLWDFIPPHPTLSLQWPFLFIGLPLLLYKFFRNINCQPIIALAGTSLYLTSSGFLSPIVHLSHPAKSMVNFFSILCLATITQLYRTAKTNDVSIKGVPHFRLIIISCMCWSMITFFSDETGLFLFVILGVVCYPLLLRFREKVVLLSCFFLLPIIYFLIIHFLLPWLHFIVNHRVIDLMAYRDFPRLSSLFWPNWHDLFINLYLLCSVHPNLKWNFAPLLGHPFLIFLQCAYTLAFLFLAGLFVYSIYRTKRFSSRIKQILAGVALLVIFIFFHTFQLSHNVRVWPVFWYGCLFSLIYYSTLTLILQFLWEEFKGNLLKRTYPFIILIFTAHGLMTSTYLIRIFKNQSYNPAVFYYPSIFSGQITPYQYFNLSQSLKSSQCRYLFTLMYWSKVKHKNISLNSSSHEIQSCFPLMNSDIFARVDLSYVVIEAAFEFPLGHSFLNNPLYVSTWMRQTGEPP